MRSRAAINATDSKASAAYGLNALAPGRMMTSTPINPTRVANQRLHPTGAPRNSAAPAVNARGVNCRMAVHSAIGM